MLNYIGVSETAKVIFILKTEAKHFSLNLKKSAYSKMAVLSIQSWFYALKYLQLLERLLSG